MNLINNNSKVKKFIINGNHEKAIEYLIKLISKNKDIIYNSLILSQLYLMQKNLNKAINVLEKNLSVIHSADKEYQFETYKSLGDYYCLEEKYNKSFSYYQNALPLKKNDHQILSSIADIYMNIDNYIKAGQIISFLLKEEPDNINYKCLLLHYFIDTQNFEKADNILSKLLKQYPDNLLLNYYMGYYQFNIDNHEKAIGHFNFCLKDKALRFKSEYYIGKTELKKGNTKKAIEYFENAKHHIDYESRLTLDLHYTLSLCFENIKDYANALIELRAIYNKNPDYKDIKEKLISENYKNISNTYLMEYNSLSLKNFNGFCEKFISKLNLKLLKKLQANESMIIFLTRADKIDFISKILNNYIHYEKNEKVLVLFIRLLKINEHTLSEILNKIKDKYNKGLLLTSESISPLAVEFGKKKQFKIITQTFLNDIIKEIQ